MSALSDIMDAEDHEQYHRTEERRAAERRVVEAAVKKVAQSAIDVFSQISRRGIESELAMERLSRALDAHEEQEGEPLEIRLPNGSWVDVKTLIDADRRE